MNETKHIYWQTYKGKRVLRISYAGLGGEDGEEYAISILNYVHEFVLKAGNNLLILVDLKDAYATTKIIQMMKGNIASEKPLIKKEAVLGLNKAKMILLKAVSLFTNVGLTAFDTETEALDWLIKKA